MNQVFETAMYLLEIILKEKGCKYFRLDCRKNIWTDLYGCLLKKCIDRAERIAMDIFGKDTYTEKITQKTLEMLCHSISRHIEPTSVAKRNQSFSRASACVLAVAKIVSRIKERCLEVDILYYICLDNIEKLENLLQENRCIEFISTRLKGLTPIHLSVIWNNNDALQVLLKTLSEKLIDQKDFYGIAPLHYAVLQGNVLSARLLLLSGANPNLKLQSNSTALHLAAFKVCPELILLLCKHGADVNSTDTDGNTPLLMVASSRRDLRERLGDHYTAISLLLRYGSSPNAKNLREETPLNHVSSSCIDVNCAYILVVAGATLDKAAGVSKSERISWFLEKTRKCLPLRLEVLCSIASRKAIGADFESKLKKWSEQLPREIQRILLFQKLPKMF